MLLEWLHLNISGDQGLILYKCRTFSFSSALKNNALLKPKSIKKPSDFKICNDLHLTHDLQLGHLNTEPCEQTNCSTLFYY